MTPRGSPHNHHLNTKQSFHPEVPFRAAFELKPCRRPHHRQLLRAFPANRRLQVCVRALKVLSYPRVDMDMATGLRAQWFLQAHLPWSLLSTEGSIWTGSLTSPPCMPSSCLFGQGRVTPCCACLPGRNPAYHAHSRPTAGDSPAPRCCPSLMLRSLTAAGFSPLSASA